MRYFGFATATAPVSEAAAFARFATEHDAHTARANNGANVVSQEAQLAAQARLAVAMLQRLAGGGEPCSEIARVCIEGVEAGNLTIAEALTRLEAASPDDAEAASATEDGGGNSVAPGGSSRASEQKEEIDTLPINYRRALRPHLNPPATYKFASAVERFADRTSRQERQVFDLRGPAAYHPQWQAEASYTPVPPSVTMPTAVRFPQPSAGVGGLGSATQTAAYYMLPSSVGPQISSTMRSMPVTAASAPTSAFAPQMAISGTGRPLHRRPHSGRTVRVQSGPGPGAYNA